MPRDLAGIDRSTRAGSADALHLLWVCAAPAVALPAHLGRFVCPPAPPLLVLRRA